MSGYEVKVWSVKQQTQEFHLCFWTLETQNANFCSAALLHSMISVLVQHIVVWVCLCSTCSNPPQKQQSTWKFWSHFLFSCQKHLCWNTFFWKFPGYCLHLYHQGHLGWGLRIGQSSCPTKGMVSCNLCPPKQLESCCTVWSCPESMKLWSGQMRVTHHLKIYTKTTDFCPFGRLSETSETDIWLVWGKTIHLPFWRFICLFVTRRLLCG